MGLDPLFIPIDESRVATLRRRPQSRQMSSAEIQVSKLHCQIMRILKDGTLLVIFLNRIFAVRFLTGNFHENLAKLNIPSCSFFFLIEKKIFFCKIFRWKYLLF